LIFVLHRITLCTMHPGLICCASAMQRPSNEGIQVNQIRGGWVAGTDSVNTAQYLQNIANGMSKENAALNTWTGQMSQKFGYTKVDKIEPLAKLPMSHSGNRHLLAQILDGKSPSIVLNMMLEADQDLDKYALADIFLEEYGRLDSRILPVIWHWKSVKSIRGISDQKFDEAVLTQMRSVGYMV
jgi:hypothetical protein